MKKINYSLAIICAFLLTACGNSLDLNEQESISQIEQIIKKELGEDFEFKYLRISALKEMNSDFYGFSVSYIRDDVEYTRDYDAKTEIMSEEKKDMIQNAAAFAIMGTPKQIKVSDLNFSLINEKYEEAIKLLAEESLADFHLNDWGFSANKKGKVESGFTIHATKPGDSPSLDGRRITSNYYEVSFTVKEDGTLELQS